MDDPYDLQRFVEAQEEGGAYERALGELRRGRKESHWMWFVFPQIAGLGHSSVSKRFSISGLGEAEAYLAHPLLGPRLCESAAVLAELGRTDPEQVVGGVDAMKLRSSMTLFMLAAAREEVFQQVLDQYFEGIPDQKTEHLASSRRQE